MSTHERAEQRINETPELEQYRDVLLYDWPNRGEHLRWVLSAPVAEIIAWRECVRAGEATDALEDAITEDL